MCRLEASDSSGKGRKNDTEADMSGPVFGLAVSYSENADIGGRSYP